MKLQSTPACDKEDSVLSRVAPILTLIALGWLVFAGNRVFGDGLKQYGIILRRLGNLLGTLWLPFLPGSFIHLGASTLPLLVPDGVLGSRSNSECALVIWRSP